ncbi:MAG TPA: metalloregulator ArsR/SmtB family transcription factor [Polyangiaceae bacterium]|jgi:DNA-binding transcriptional ArsR family regulator|nr:metalloregulator ArsR/SmtB family transcription factor [Polyangiaceae bacterium]
MSRKGRLSAAVVRDSAPVFAALGDETRLRLVARLSERGPQSIARLAEGEPVTRQAITKHLRVLADAGVARDQRRGRERLWALERRSLDEARRCLDLVSQDWDEALARLKAFVET